MISNYYRTTQKTNELERITLTISQEKKSSSSHSNIANKTSFIWKKVFSDIWIKWGLQ